MYQFGGFKAAAALAAPAPLWIHGSSTLAVASWARPAYALAGAESALRTDGKEPSAERNLRAGLTRAVSEAKSGAARSFSPARDCEKRPGEDVVAAKRTDHRRQQELPQDEVASGGQTQGSGDADSGPPRSDLMLDLWVSWLEQYFGAARDWVDSDKPWWQVTADELAGKMLDGGVKQFNDILAKDPILRSIDQMWNANPLREVVPVDWAEITRALRTVSLHSLRKPENAIAAVAELNLTLWRSAIDIWTEAGKRWWGLSGSRLIPRVAAAPSDKRFAAPEWHSNPIYRTLKELYLLASDWLLKRGEIEGMDEAERQRLNFHLRQFVDAMSPSLCCCPTLPPCAGPWRPAEPA